jgi:hypothetical protein
MEEENLTYHHGGGSSAAFGCSRVIGEAVLVHDPVGLDAPGRLAPVEHEGLLDPDVLAGGSGQDGLVGAGGLPVPGPGGAVGPGAVEVLALPRAEEVPLLLPEEQSFGCR